MRHSPPRGLTVIETLVAASVVLVALVAVASMFPTASFNVTEGGRMSRAAALAQGALEAAKNTPFASLASGACSGATVPTGYTCAQTVTLSGASPNRVAAVTVSVTWRSAQRSGTVSLATRLSEP
jgi:Tfp pilus assembly protein PilV